MQGKQILFMMLIILSMYSCRQEASHSISTADNHIVSSKDRKDVRHDYSPPVVISLLDRPSPEMNRSASMVFRNLNAVAALNQSSSGEWQFVSESAHDHFITYSTEQGLALSTVLCSYSDKAGNLWFGTQGGGVNKYNGKEFKTYSAFNGLANNVVFCIAEDMKGHLWFGTDGGGVSHYDGVSFTNYTEKDGLAGKTVRDIHVDRSGNLYFTFDEGGISRLDADDNQKEHIVFRKVNGADELAHEVIRCIEEDKQGNLWLGTQENGLILFNQNGIRRFRKDQGMSGDEIRSILADSHGRLWVGTRDGGLSIADIESLLNGELHFTNYSDEDGLPGNTVRSIVEDRKGAIWIGSKDGISKYVAEGNTAHFTNYSIINGLSSNNIWSITEDYAGNMWFCTGGGGVNKYCGESFSNFTTGQGLANNSIWGVEEGRNGNLIFGTDGNGICQYNNVTHPVYFKNYTTADGLFSNIIPCIKTDSKQNIWLGSREQGVSRLNNDGCTNYTTREGLAGNFVLCIAEDAEGDMWFGTADSGVSKFTREKSDRAGNTFTTFTNYTTAQGLANNIVSCITKDHSGNLWFGTQEGISLLKQGKVGKGESHFVNYSIREGLAGKSIFCITEGLQGDLYIGTENGLSIFRLPENPNERVNVKNYSTMNGLPDNHVTNVLTLPDHKIAVGTNDGIAIFNPDASLDPSGKLSGLNIYNTNTGYPIKDVNEQGSMFLDSKGVIWAGTGYDKIGLIRFDYRTVAKNPNPPNVVIENIKLNEQDICWYSLLHDKQHKFSESDLAIEKQQEINAYGYVMGVEEERGFHAKYDGIRFDSISPFYNVPGHLVLPYEHNQIIIEFNCIEVSRHDMVNFQYKLEGYDKDWSPVLKKTEAIFGNMSEGHYSFKVKAQSPDGVWSEPVVFSFTVLPPWYRTWWAYLLYLLGSISLIMAGFRWRTGELKKREEQLKQTVKDRTEELVSEKREVERQKEETEKQYRRSEELLRNILPEEIAEELKLKGKVEAKQFQEVTVLFTDFVNFTGISQTLSPERLVSEVHLCYTAFDDIMERNGMEKIKTIGDAYLAVSGIPNADKDHALRAIRAAKEIIAFIDKRKNEGGMFDIRIGLSSGPVVAGIVGIKKFAYDIWGDTVNTAARMEQNSELGKINISGETYRLIKGQMTCIPRGKIVAKNKGEIDMYFVE